MSKKPDAPIALPGLDALVARDGRWFLNDHEDDRAARLTRAAAQIRKNDQARQKNLDRYESLYSNLPLFSVTKRRYTQTTAELSRDRLALNVVKSCSDSLVAKLTNERPRVSCVTSAGDWDLQQRGEALETFLDGMFYETDVYETAPQVALDMSAGGTGVVKIYAEGDGENEHIVIERKSPRAISCDEEEAYDGKPRTLYESAYVDRLVAMGTWGREDKRNPLAGEDLARRLAVCPREGEEDGQNAVPDTSSDQIRIDEAWHLPSFPGADDGRHTIACGSILILDEPWKHDWFPFVFLYRQRPQCGVWGVGLGEELQGLQFEINVILNMIRKAMRMSGTLRWWVENNSHVNTQYISDLIGSIGRYTGTMPTPITPPVAAPEVYQHLVFLYGKAFEVSGVGQLSATSMAPANEESGRAKEVRLDTESERFSVAFGLYQDFFIKIARQVIALAREIADRNPLFKVRAVGRAKMMEVVKWADVNLENEQFLLQMAPTNKRATDPSAHMQQVLDWLNAGGISVRQAQRLTQDNPDFKEEMARVNASYNLTMDMITDILKHGKFRPPEPFMNLDPAKEDNAVVLFQQSYLMARRSGVPEPKLEMMRQWIQQAIDLTKPAANDQQPPTPPGPQPPGAPPPGPPMNGAPPPMAAAA